MSASINDDFPHSWTAKLLSAAPLIAPARQFTYPVSVPGEEDALQRGALLVEVKPRAGGIFLATAALGFRDAQMPSGLYSCPNPDDLLILSGGYAYLIDTNQPDRCHQIPLRPVLSVLPVPEEKVILFAGHCEIAAVGDSGLRWHSERISWEGIQLLRVEAGVLHGTGWDMTTDRDMPFTIDLATGKHQGGGFRQSERK